MDEEFTQDVDCIGLAAEKLAAGVEVDDVELLGNDGEKLLEVAVVNLKGEAFAAQCADGLLEGVLVAFDGPDVRVGDPSPSEGHEVGEGVGTGEEEHRQVFWAFDGDARCLERVPVFNRVFDRIAQAGFAMFFEEAEGVIHRPVEFFGGDDGAGVAVFGEAGDGTRDDPLTDRILLGLAI